jgi:type IV pilus assembly protein PilC
MGTDNRFEYAATTVGGRRVEGSIMAPSIDEARQQLREMSLDPIERIEPIAGTRPIKSLGTADFVAFNDQLIQLSRAGMPIETGMRVVADDLRSGRLKSAVDAVVRELDAGQTLARAIDNHRGAFPSLYADVIDAGVKSNNLPGLLSGMSRHAVMTRELKWNLIRSVAYPAAVLVGLAVVALFLGKYVFPILIDLFESFRLETNIRAAFVSKLWGRSRPLVSSSAMLQAGMIAGTVLPWVVGSAIVAVVGSVMAWPVLRKSGLDRTLIDRVFMRVPLVGPVLRFGFMSRWCDVARLGVDAGMDLPAAMRLAAGAIGSPRLSADSDKLISSVESGRGLDGVTDLDLMPATVPTLIDISTRTGGLSSSLGSLSRLYLDHANARSAAIPVVLLPLLVILVGAAILAFLAAILGPLLALIEGISG